MSAVLLLAIASVASLPADTLPEPPANPSPEWSLPVAPRPPPMNDWSVSGSLLFGIADAFFGKVVPAVAVRRRTGPLAMEAFGAKSFSFAAPTLELCPSSGACSAPTAAQLSATTGQLSWFAGVGAVLRTSTAKWSVGGLDAANVSLEASAGLAAIGYEWSDASRHDVTTAGVRWSVAAAGQLTGPMELRAEFGGLVYPTDVRHTGGVERQLFLGASLAWTPGRP